MRVSDTSSPFGGLLYRHFIGPANDTDNTEYNMIDIRHAAFDWYRYSSMTVSLFLHRLRWLIAIIHQSPRTIDDGLPIDDNWAHSARQPVSAFLKAQELPLVSYLVPVVVVLTLTRIIKSVVTGRAPVTLEWRNTPGKKHKQKQKWCTHIS